MILSMKVILLLKIFYNQKIKQRMRYFIYMLFALTALLLTACSGSDTYRGDWKATDSKGVQLDITFEAKNFILKYKDGKIRDFNYSQNSVKTENFVETYGIKLDDGRRYDIHFPIASDESMGFIVDGGGKIMYTISRDEYKTRDDIYRLD